MNEDLHLGTGEYDPHKYWEARAKAKGDDVYKAVCGFGLSDAENAAMDSVQAAVFASMLRRVELRHTRVMELGCGVGRWAPLVLSRGAAYVGLDISEAMIKIAESRVPRGTFSLLLSDKLPFPDDSCGLSFSITVLHHNPYERQLP